MSFPDFKANGNISNYAVRKTHCTLMPSCLHHPKWFQTCNSSKLLVALWLAIPLPRRVEIIGNLGRIRSLSYSDGKHLEPPGVEEREHPVLYLCSTSSTNFAQRYWHRLPHPNAFLYVCYVIQNFKCTSIDNN